MKAPQQLAPPSSESLVSAETPDWSRESKLFWQWHPSRSLLASLRAHARVRSSSRPDHVARRWLAVLRHRFWSAVTGAAIPLGCRISGGLLLPHPNGVVIHPGVEIGPNCLIFQQVTLGSGGPVPGVPFVGGHVDIGAGAKVLGGIVLAEHAKVGANAVLLCDLPAGATAVGIPARVAGAPPAPPPLEPAAATGIAVPLNVPAGKPVQIVNLSELDPHWHWLKPAFPHRPELVWDHVTSLSSTLPAGVPKRMTLARMLAARRAVSLLRNSGGRAMLVSHGPRPTMYGALALGRRAIATPHLAYSFNFTDLPTGANRGVMSKAFESVSEFTVFSNVERALYADYFDLPVERFTMRHWAVRKPTVGDPQVARIAGDYICALGSQARDYRVLFEAMKYLPAIRLVVVTNPECVAGLDRPANVEVMSQVPLEQTMNILAHSRMMVLPLRDSTVPCGHVTLVSAMHLGKACVVTDSLGVSDYVQMGVNGLTTEACDSQALKSAIVRLYESEELCRRYGGAGAAFATEHCSEVNAAQYFEACLSRLVKN